MFFKCLEFAVLFPYEMEFHFLFLKFMEEKSIENLNVEYNKYIRHYSSPL